MSDALKQFIAEITNKPKTAKKKTIREDKRAVHKLESSRWSSEQVVFLITQTTCTCGATSKQTNPHALIRRFHPQHGIHEEAVAIAHKCADKHNFPVVEELREITITNCHECLNPEVDNPCNQLELFA